MKKYILFSVLFFFVAAAATFLVHAQDAFVRQGVLYTLIEEGISPEYNISAEEGVNISQFKDVDGVNPNAIAAIGVGDIPGKWEYFLAGDTEWKSINLIANSYFGFDAREYRIRFVPDDPAQVLPHGSDYPYLVVRKVTGHITDGGTFEPGLYPPFGNVNNISVEGDARRYEVRLVNAVSVFALSAFLANKASLLETKRDAADNYAAKTDLTPLTQKNTAQDNALTAQGKQIAGLQAAIEELKKKGTEVTTTFLSVPQAVNGQEVIHTSVLVH